MLKVMTIVGTRPEIIRLSRTIPKLDRLCRHVLVHTGQNFDFELNQVFFSELEIRQPDHFLGAAGGTLGETLGRILSQTERVIAEEKPDAVLILGDTNSAISAVMARRMKVPVYHMEAGNRSFDRNVPEESNRKVVDHISDFNLVYTEHARRHLIAEGYPQRRIYLSGSPMREVLEHFRPQIDSSKILTTLGLPARHYFIASLHREENVDNSFRLKGLLQALTALADHFNKPVVVSTHPRTRKRLETLGVASGDQRVRFLKPFGFFDYNHLQKQSLCAISDSGTVAEEAAILGFCAVTPRDAIERPEALDSGCITLSGLTGETMVPAIEAAITTFEERPVGDLSHVPADYLPANTSDRVVSLILSTARVSNQWDGIRLNDLS